MNTLVIPRFDYSDNIFHYARGLLYAFHVIWRQNIIASLVFQSSTRISVIDEVWNLMPEDTLWSMGFRNIIESGMNSVRIRGFGGGKLSKKERDNENPIELNKKWICIENGAWVLGKEAKFDAFLYLNDSAIPVVEKKNRNIVHIDVPIDALRFRDVVEKKHRNIVHIDVPIDALRFRELVYHYTTKTQLDNSNQQHKPRRETDFDNKLTQFDSKSRLLEFSQEFITKYSVSSLPLNAVYIKRKPNSLRSFTQQSEIQFQSLLTRLCSQFNVNFQSVRFEKMEFLKQIQIMKQTNIIVGIHGANLVNSVLFSPVFSSLFEIFPYKYSRQYYYGASSSGMYYQNWEVTNGIPLPCDTLFRSKHHSAHQHEDQIQDLPLKCRLAYRNQPLNLSQFDLNQIELKLHNILEYMTSLHQIYQHNSTPTLSNLFSTTLEYNILINP
eukprot:CAMPEP_0182451562 /NCGR_PEP_ID=MMETSP1172-20130603/43787_1 /TAXON_ID=708627 /ORGANISM="Timspurckia oligopyrenoides, Strain CCMP3278" /LENGTH=439 /DNA_ID=CAMNT_0024649345 /DNA_START=528 /DNA_END=1847 /DNA_ORIENTATION=+